MDELAKIFRMVVMGEDTVKRILLEEQKNCPNGQEKKFQGIN